MEAYKMIDLSMPGKGNLWYRVYSDDGEIWSWYTAGGNPEELRCWSKGGDEEEVFLEWAIEFEKRHYNKGFRLYKVSMLEIITIAGYPEVKDDRD